jgi:hypothetical protein
MPVSNEDIGAPQGLTLAVTAEALYLANLLVAPGLAFVILLVIYLKTRRQAAPLAAAHLSQTIAASLWAGALLVIANLAILVLGGYRGAYTWMIVILYFTLAHSSLVLCGALGLSRALAGQCWRFPLVGRPLPAGCAEVRPV